MRGVLQRKPPIVVAIRFNASSQAEGTPAQPRESTCSATDYEGKNPAWDPWASPAGKIGEGEVFRGRGSPI